MSEAKITAIAPWFGGKRTLAPRIIEALGKHTAYWEPFCGSMAVLLAKNQHLQRQSTISMEIWSTSRDACRMATWLSNCFGALRYTMLRAASTLKPQSGIGSEPIALQAISLTSIERMTISYARGTDATEWQARKVTTRAFAGGSQRTVAMLPSGSLRLLSPFRNGGSDCEGNHPQRRCVRAARKD